METMNVKTWVLCRDANGSAAFFGMNVDLPKSSYELGYHYDIAMKSAEVAGYESPMHAFDEHEPAGRVLGVKTVLDTNLAPAVLVWAGEGGVEAVIADFPLRYAVVSTDTEYADADCLHQINAGMESHEVLCHTGVGTVNTGEADSVWNQVRKVAEQDLWQPVDYRQLDAIPAQAGAEQERLMPAQATSSLVKLRSALDTHRQRFQKALGTEGGVE